MNSKQLPVFLATAELGVYRPRLENLMLGTASPQPAVSLYLEHD